MPTQIKFGTDGWRGIIADDYTFDNVRRVGNAIAKYVHKNEDVSKGLAIGYDTRFQSRNFAEAIRKRSREPASTFAYRMTTRPPRRSRMRWRTRVSPAA